MIEKLKEYLRIYYPAIIVAAAAFILFWPYLSGKNIITGGMERYDILDYILNANMGWINFYKMAGEFIGGFMSYGSFNPLYYLIKWSGLSNNFQTEHLIMLVYFVITLSGAYYFFKKNNFNSYISIFSASVYALNGISFEWAQSTAMGFIITAFLPLLFLQAQKSFAGYSSKIIFVSILVFESIDAIHFQHVVLQTVLVFFYLLFLNRKAIKTFFVLSAISTIGMIPQTFLTLITMKYSPAFTTASSASGWPVIALAQIFHPFIYISTTYIDPHFYTSVLASITFLIYLPWLFIKKPLQQNYKFFAIAAVVCLVLSIDNNPLVFILSKIPLVNIFLSRNYYRYVLYYFFAMSCAVAYVLSYIITNKEEVVKYFKRFFYIGLIAIVSLVSSSAVIVTFGSKIKTYLTNWFVKNKLPYVRGDYPDVYYLSLLKKSMNFYINNFSLLSLDGIIMSLPFLSFLIFGALVFVKKYREKLVEIFPVFLVANIIITASIFSLIMGQNKIPMENFNIFKNDPKTFSNQIKTNSDWRNNYVLSYGDYSGATFIENSYSYTPEIDLWLMRNFYFPNYMIYNSTPGFMIEFHPFKPLRQSLVGGYIGYMFYQRGENSLNENVGNNGRKITLDGYADNLRTRINFLRNLGIRYVVSHYDLSDIKGLKKIQENEFYKESDFIPGYKAKLYLYEIENYGQIIFVPKNIKTIKFDSIDIDDLNSVKNIFDDLNSKDLTTIEETDSTKVTGNTAAQDPVSSKISGVVYGKDKISFHSEFAKDSYAIVNVNYYPGWRAYIDGKEQNIGRANIDFMSVYISAGVHDIVLSFDIKKMITGTL